MHVLAYYMADTQLMKKKKSTNHGFLVHFPTSVLDIYFLLIVAIRSLHFDYVPGHMICMSNMSGKPLHLKCNDLQT